MIIKLIGLINGGSTPFDGQYLVEYDPTRQGVDPNGDPMYAHIVCTPDPAKALQLTFAEAAELWQKSAGTRWDGKPNRPITAFSVEIS